MFRQKHPNRQQQVQNEDPGPPEARILGSRCTEFASLLPAVWNGEELGSGKEGRKWPTALHQRGRFQV